MPITGQITSKRTGQTYAVTFEKPPTETDIDEAAAHLDKPTWDAYGVDPSVGDQGPVGTAAMSVPQTFAKVGTGMVGGAARILDKGAQVVANATGTKPSGFFGDVADATDELSAEADRTYPTNPLNAKAAAIGSGAAQGLTLMAGGIAGKALGLGNAALTAVPVASGFFSGANQGIQQAENIGVQSPEGQLAMGLLFGGVEAGTERMFGLGSKGGTQALMAAWKKPAAQVLAQAAKTITGEGTEEIVAGSAQDLLTRAFAMEDPNRPGYTTTGVELPKMDRRMLKQRGLEALGGAAGGTIFAGGQVLHNVVAPVAPQVVRGQPLVRTFTRSDGQTFNVSFKTEPSAQDLADAQGHLEGQLQHGNVSPNQAAAATAPNQFAGTAGATAAPGGVAGGNPFAGPITAPAQPTEAGGIVAGDQAVVTEQEQQQMDGTLPPPTAEEINRPPVEVVPVPTFQDDPYGTVQPQPSGGNVLFDYGIPRTPEAQAQYEQQKAVYAQLKPVTVTRAQLVAQNDESRRLTNFDKAQQQASPVQSTTLPLHQVLPGDEFTPRSAQNSKASMTKVNADHRQYQKVQDQIDNLETMLEQQGVDIYKLYDPQDKYADILEKTGWKPMPAELSQLYARRDAIGSSQLDETKISLRGALQKAGLTAGEQNRVLNHFAINPQDSNGVNQAIAAQHAQAIAARPSQHLAEEVSYALASERGQPFDELRDVYPDTLRDAAKAVQIMQAYFGSAREHPSQALNEADPDPFMPAPRNFTRGALPGLAAASATMRGTNQTQTGSGDPVTVSADLLAAAHAAAAVGSSTPMVTIKRVFLEAQKLQPGITLPQFLEALHEADNNGTAYLEVYDKPHELTEAGDHVLRNASGIPAVRMMMAPQEEGDLAMPDGRARTGNMATKPGAAHNAELSPGGLSEAMAVQTLSALKAARQAAYTAVSAFPKKQKVESNPLFVAARGAAHAASDKVEIFLQSHPSLRGPSGHFKQKTTATDEDNQAPSAALEVEEFTPQERRSADVEKAYDYLQSLKGSPLPEQSVFYQSISIRQVEKSRQSDSMYVALEMIPNALFFERLKTWDDQSLLEEGIDPDIKNHEFEMGPIDTPMRFRIRISDHPTPASSKTDANINVSIDDGLTFDRGNNWYRGRADFRSFSLAAKNLFQVRGIADELGLKQQTPTVSSEGSVPVGTPDLHQGADRNLPQNPPSSPEVNPESSRAEDGTLAMPAHLQRPAVAGPLPSNYSGAAPTLPGQAQPWSGRVQSLMGIRKYLLNAVGLPAVGVGRFKRALGIYRVKPQSVRMQAINDIPVLAHEVGHAVHYRVLSGGAPVAETWNGRHDAELNALGAATSLPTYTAAMVRKEGVAEFTRLWLTNPVEAWARAPHFAAFWQSEIQQRNPGMYEALQRAQGMIADYVAMPETQRAMAQISFDPAALQPQGTVGEWMRTAYAQMVNTLEPMLRVVRQAQEMNPALDVQAQDLVMWAENHRGGAASKASADIFQSQTDLHGNVVGPGLQKILADLQPGENTLFSTYLALKRAQELERRGLRSGFENAHPPAAEMRALEARFEPTRIKLQKWMKNGKNLLVQAGLLDGKSSQAMDDANEDYVPFYRLYEKLNGVSFGPEGTQAGGGYVDLNSGLRRIKGSDRAIVDPLQSVMKNAYMFRKLAEQNVIGQKFFDLVKEVHGHGLWGEEIAPKMQPTMIKHDEVVKKLVEQGVIQNATQLPANADLTLRLFQAMTKPDTKNGEVVIFRNGKREHWQIKDPMLMHALKYADADAAKLNGIAGWFKALFTLPARALRFGATGGPWFALPNIIRDTVQGGVMSTSKGKGATSFVPFFDTVRGGFNILMKRGAFEQWKQAGGEFSGMVSGTKAFTTLLEDALPKDPVMQRAMQGLADPQAWKAGLRNALDLVGAFGQFSERATRVGEFMRAKDNGASDMLAANFSKTVSLNFARAGETSRVLNQFIPFLNANIQGLDQFWQAHANPKTRAATMLKGLMFVTLPSLLCWALGKDDEELQNLPDYRKNLFWNINLKPLAAALGMPERGFILSIPKPFLLGAVYGTSVEKALDYATARDPNGARKAANNILQNTLNPFDVMMSVGGIRPIIEVRTNHSIWADKPIVPEAYQNLPKPFQYSVLTSETAKMLGKFTGQSPMMVDHLLRGYFATAGKFGTDVIDYGMAKLSLTDVPPPPRKGVMEWPILNRFAGSPYQSNAFVSRFYEASKDMEGKLSVFNKQSENLTADEQKKWFAANRDELGHYLRLVDVQTRRTGAGDVRAAQATLSELNAAMKTMQASKVLSPDVKRARMIELTQTRNKVAENGFKTLFPESVRLRHW